MQASVLTFDRKSIGGVHGGASSWSFPWPLLQVASLLSWEAAAFQLAKISKTVKSCLAPCRDTSRNTAPPPFTSIQRQPTCPRSEVRTVKVSHLKDPRHTCLPLCACQISASCGSLASLASLSHTCRILKRQPSPTTRGYGRKDKKHRTHTQEPQSRHHRGITIVLLGASASPSVPPFPLAV